MKENMNLTPTKDTKTVGVASSLVSAENLSRASEILCNASANDMYLSFGSAAEVGKGIYLAPGDQLVYGRETDIPFTGNVYAIGAAAALTMSIQTLSY